MPDFPLGQNPERGTVQARASRDDARPISATDDAALLLLAKKRFHSTANSESKVRSEQLEDLRFYDNEQWPAQIKAERALDGRPCITINRLPPFVRQVINQQRQSKPAITINPVDSGSDPKTAEVLQGIIRHIEVNSQADIAYDTACEHQVVIGRGFFRVISEWNEMSPWEQDIKVKRIRNPFTVYFDPSCLEADYSDARYAFIIEDIPRDEFVMRYGEDAARSAELFSSTGDQAADWMPEGKVRIAEYYYIDERDEDVSLLSDGSEQPTAHVKQPAMQQLLQESGVKVVRSRKIRRRTVKWAKITGSQVLERRDWPGRWIPIVPVLGDEIDINGRVDIRGMVRNAREPQMAYNFWVTAETEAIALAPKSPFIVAAGQIEGFEAKWRLANRRNLPYLEYNPISLDGTMVPAPERNAVEPPIAAIVAATKQADNDLKAVTGIYDAALGERGPDEAAKAIMARQKQSDIANINWVDNLARAMRALGRILLDLIPQIYDVPRVMRIMGLDDQPRMVLVHAGNPDAASDVDEDVRSGIDGIYDLSVGRYDVTVSVGPSYQSKREEAVAAIMAFVQAFPPAAPAVGDVLVENMDWPGAQLIAKRLRKMIPPGLQEEQGGDAEQQATMLQQKLQQQGQVMQMLTAHVNDLTDQIKSKSVEAASRERVAASTDASRERIAAMQMQNSLLIAQIGALKQQEIAVNAQGHESLLASMEGIQDAQQNALDRQHEATLALHQSAHDQAMGAQQHVQAVDQQQQGHAQDMAAQQQQTQADQQSQVFDAAAQGAKQAQQQQGDQQAQQADQQHEAALSAVANAHDFTLDAAKKQHEAELSRIQREHEVRMTKLQQQHETAMTSHQQHLDVQQADAERKHQIAVAKLKPKPTPKAK